MLAESARIQLTADCLLIGYAFCMSYDACCATANLALNSFMKTSTSGLIALRHARHESISPTAAFESMRTTHGASRSCISCRLSYSATHSE